MAERIAGLPDPWAPLVVTVAPPCAGKSTWVAGRFNTTELFGLDMFRRLVTGGDVLDQGATPAAAEIMGTVVAFRMDTARTTVVDATNATPEHRDRLLSAASLRRRPTVAVLLHTPLEVCIARNENRGPAPWPGANDRPLDDPAIIRKIHAAVWATPPTTDDVDLLVHVHPDDPAIAYAYPGEGIPAAWCEQLLGNGRWGRGITLLPAGAPLPWLAGGHE